MTLVVVREEGGDGEKMEDGADVAAEYGEILVGAFGFGAGDVGVVHRLEVVEAELEAAEFFFGDGFGDE